MYDVFGERFYPDGDLASVGDKDLGMVHDGAICPHSGMDRMILPRMPLVKMLLILIRLRGSHAEAACSPVKGTRSSEGQWQDIINETAFWSCVQVENIGNMRDRAMRKA